MSVNKARDHVFVLAEDDANRQLALGFATHPSVCNRCIQVMGPLGGWTHVRDGLRDDYANLLETNRHCHVVLLVDFDRRETRRGEILTGLPAQLADRVFVFGVWSEPERLRAELRIGFEAIGQAIAGECEAGTGDLLAHALLAHNQAEVARMIETIKPFVFQPRS